MKLVLGGVTHDPINARHRFERVWTAHRQKKDKPTDAHRIARVPCDEFLFFVFSPRLWKKHGLSGCKKGPAK
jgi:hypothetical protein